MTSMSISALVHRNHLRDGTSGLQIEARGGDEEPALTTCGVEPQPRFDS